MTTKKTAMMTRLARECVLNSTTTTTAAAVELEQIQGKKIPVRSEEPLRCRCCTKSEFGTVPSPGIDCGRSYEIWKHCREPSGHRSAINGQDLNPEIRSIHNSWTELRNSVAYAVTLAIPRRTSHRLGLRSNMIYMSTTENDGRGLYL